MQAGLLAAALAALVYVNALDNPFVYDDHDTVVANPSLADPSNIRFVLVHSPFRPVVNVSYAIDRAIWGYRPFGFHLTNVLLHAVVVALLYALLVRALADLRRRKARDDEPGPRPRRGAENRRPPALTEGRIDAWAAFTGAALFGVHPLMTEAVGYVSGRSELLCGVFFLAALLCTRAAMNPVGVLSEKGVSFYRPGRASGIFFRDTQLLALGGSLVFGLLAMLSKEVAVVLPIVVLAYDWLVLPSTAEARRARLKFVFVPGILLLGLAAAYRLSMAAGPVSSDTPLLNLLTQSIVIWRYLGLLILPVGQSIMHGIHRVTSVADPRALVAFAGLVGLAVAAYLMRRAQPLASFGIVW